MRETAQNKPDIFKSWNLEWAEEVNLKHFYLGGKMEKEILTIEEAAEYLRMGKRSIYKLAKSGKIPCKKILNKYRFDKESLRDWVLGKN